MVVSVSHGVKSQIQKIAQAQGLKPGKLFSILKEPISEVCLGLCVCACMYVLCVCVCMYVLCVCCVYVSIDLQIEHVDMQTNTWLAVVLSPACPCTVCTTLYNISGT